ncbi:N-acetylmuramoyl-L-alanine amidase [Ancylothrix sp. C2]|uniref:N-acetylmuramoyl-L-alanine amidase n=1 Tax=Ancylothrix sp. D3o TaxID=2953691 RepID=UPI0021BAE78F|nr:N-acetylmuramoyl-L-alanine amidase [Ancylothrix sp. D3o]MCT7950815.1 N-acetylmuramoyl-L-alanine amidase [Ancylothrix sp. D3o]
MKKILGLALIGSMISVSSAHAQQGLFVAYPSPNHTTNSDRIFLIGSAPPGGEVLVNNQKIERSPGGHFAPTFPLKMGENLFSLRYQNQELQIKVTRESTLPVMPVGLAFAKDSLTPAVDIYRKPGELICFGAVAPANAQVSVQLAGQSIPLFPTQKVELPPNSAVLTDTNQPTTTAGKYQGCASASAPGNLGKPQFQLTLNGQTITQSAPGNVTILSPAEIEIAEVTVDSGVARTGPSTDHSRLTPLPKGTQAIITGREGEWLRLDYGGWIKSGETRIFKAAVPPKSIIRSVTSRPVAGGMEILFPLQVAVPVSVQQGTNTFSLTLYNTTAQTDTIRFDDNPLISRLDWQQLAPEQVQYVFNLKSAQQWGYKLEYRGTTLVLTLRTAPATNNPNQPLSGMTIMLDPGHGGPEDSGARGPNGYPEKEVTLIVSKLLREELIKRGATVLMTREGDIDLLPGDRATMINKQEPNLALSIHYNALPDNGDAMNTKGVGMFWYHTQAHSLAVFLQNYLVEKLGRPSYGVFWNNLALTRPAVAPSLLLELGFMINPYEFEWITNSEEQKKLAVALADGIVEWVAESR